MSAVRGGRLADETALTPTARGTAALSTGLLAAAVPRTLLAAALTVALAVACSTAATTNDLQGLVVDEPFELPSMTLTDTAGEPFNIRTNTEGSVRLVYFGFTNCVDICPIDVSQVAQVLDKPESPENVELLFVTVDPERDTPAVLRTFLDRFNPAFRGLRATPEQLTQLQNEVGAIAAILLDPPEAPEPDNDGGASHTHDGDEEIFAPGTTNYQVGHDGRIFAFAPDGLGYVQFPHGTRQSTIAHDLKILSELRADA